TWKPPVHLGVYGVMEESPAFAPAAPSPASAPEVRASRTARGCVLQEDVHGSDPNGRRRGDRGPCVPLPLTTPHGGEGPPRLTCNRSQEEKDAQSTGPVGGLELRSGPLVGG